MATPGEMSSEPTEKVGRKSFSYEYQRRRQFIHKYTRPVRICNPDNARQIGWAIKTNSPDRISIDPTCGVLGPKEQTFLFVRYKPFDYSSTDVSADRITLEWVFTPEGAPKQFKREWFQGDVITRRKNIPVNHIT